MSAQVRQRKRQRKIYRERDEERDGERDAGERKEDRERERKSKTNLSHLGGEGSCRPLRSGEDTLRSGKRRPSTRRASSGYLDRDIYWAF